MSEELIVVTGPPGAGKTTIGAMLADRRDPSVHVEGDAFFAFWHNGYVEPWKSDSHDQNRIVIAATAAAAATYAASGISTVLDGVVGPWFIDTVATVAKRAGVDAVHYGILTVELDTCLERFGGRHGDDAPLDMVRHMHGQFSDLGDYAGHAVSSMGTPDDALGEFMEKLGSGALSLT